MSTVRTGRRLLTAMGVALVAAGCGGASAGGGTAQPAFAGDLEEVLTIEIRNDQADEARIELWIDRRQTRLGSVQGFSSRTFHVPLNRIAQVHLEFNLTLGAHCITDSVTLGPGQDITAIIPMNLNIMRAVCRNR